MVSLFLREKNELGASETVSLPSSSLSILKELESIPNKLEFSAQGTASREQQGTASGEEATPRKNFETPEKAGPKTNQVSNENLAQPFLRNISTPPASIFKHNFGQAETKGVFFQKTEFAPGFDRQMKIDNNTPKNTPRNDNNADKKKMTDDDSNSSNKKNNNNNSFIPPLSLPPQSPQLLESILDSSSSSPLSSLSARCEKITVRRVANKMLPSEISPLGSNQKKVLLDQTVPPFPSSMPKINHSDDNNFFRSTLPQTKNHKAAQVLDFSANNISSNNNCISSALSKRSQSFFK